MVNLFQIFVQKLIYLMIFFVSICTPINNGSSLHPFAYKTNAKITSFCVTQNDILLIIKTLDLKWAQGFDKISKKKKKKKRTQIHGESIVLPLNLIFETTLKEKNSRYLENSICSSYS